MSARRKTPVKTAGVEPHQCSIDVRMAILRKLPFFSTLSDNSIAQINQLFAESGFTPGETIYFSGDPAARFLVVADGKVKISQIALSGRNILLDILTPGEFFGNLSLQPDTIFADTAQALTDVCALNIPTDTFRNILLTHPKVLLEMLDITTERLRNANERVIHLSSLPVEKRIAHVLLNLCEKLGVKHSTGILINAPLSRDDLAELTGTTPETASRVISQFIKDGLVKSGRQWIAIASLERLQSIVQES